MAAAAAAAAGERIGFLQPLAVERPREETLQARGGFSAADPDLTRLPFQPQRLLLQHLQSPAALPAPPPLPPAGLLLLLRLLSPICLLRGARQRSAASDLGAPSG